MFDYAEPNPILFKYTQKIKTKHLYQFIFMASCISPQLS